MNEIVFEIVFSGIENQFRARAASPSLHVEAPSLQEIERKMCEAVHAHFAGQAEMPKVIVVWAARREIMRISVGEG